MEKLLSKLRSIPHDKALHALTGILLYTACALVLWALGVPLWPWLALLPVAGVAWWKERRRDADGSGTPETADIWWTVVPALLPLAVAVLGSW